MSVRDVAAVDHLNSLPRPNKSTDNKEPTQMSGQRRSPYNLSLPTSPIKEGKSDGDSLRRAMARHQVMQKYLSQALLSIAGQPVQTRVPTTQPQ